MKTNKKKKPQEIELKLILESQDIQPAIIAKLRENNYKMEEPDQVRNADIYLDTFDWQLLKNKFALRYRVANGKTMYTLKSMGTIGDGIAKRMEIEIPLDSPATVPAEVHEKKIREIIDPLIQPRKLLEHIQILTYRRRYHCISPKGAEIELAFDTSSFSLRGLHTPRRSQKQYELEAELISGAEAELKSLAALLHRKFKFQPATASKLEVAFDRLHVLIPSKKIPEEFRVQLVSRLDCAVRKILHHQYDRLCEQMPGIKRDIDTEFVHQARVATRRMRSALRLFRKAVPQSTGTYLAAELKWLGSVFGSVRDLDVFLLNLPKFKEQIQRFPEKKKKVFEDWIEKHRRNPYKELVSALESPRFLNFERRLRKFCEESLPARPRAPLATKPVSEIAPLIITEKFDAVIAQGKAVLENPKLKEFHLLRIQMKRLRYACEFMAPAYNGKLDPFIERTVEIQDCLGEIQDTVFTTQFIDYLFADWKDKLVEPVLVFILGEIYQLQAEIAKEREAGFRNIWERFASEETILQLREILSLNKEA